jgi:CDP-diacylglycerol--glycerol-3-phosphate 3-phosphatidyltransferase
VIKIRLLLTSDPHRAILRPDMKIERRQWLYIPNLLSLARLLFLPVPIILIIHGHDLIALAAVALGIVSDVLDGYLARRLDQVSELGKILDPLGDKLAVATLAIALHIYRDFPFWALALIVGRDLVIMIAGVVALSRSYATPTSNRFGKLTAFAWSLLLASYLTPFDIVSQVLLVIAPAMVPISALLYIRTALVLKRRQG